MRQCFHLRAALRNDFFLRKMNERSSLDLFVHAVLRYRPIWEPIG